jgi:undecaprenyl-diphosphatase
MRAMGYLQAVVLAIVEGITEFLPVSSTGHLILASKLLDVGQTELVKSFEIVIQLGAILAVVVLYWQTMVKNWEIWKRVLIAFVPSGIVGFLVYKLVKTYLIGNVGIVVMALFWGGIVMLIVEEVVKHKERQKKSLEKLRFSEAVVIGLGQAVAMIPGVSRAMATIFGGLGVGLTRKSAVEFSFLLAVPTMAAAAGWDLIKTGLVFGSGDWQILAVGFVGAFASALVAIRFLVGLVQKHSFRVFACYRIGLAIVFWLGESWWH